MAKAMMSVRALVLFALSAHTLFAMETCSKGDEGCAVGEGDATNLMQGHGAKSFLRNQRTDVKFVVPSFVPYFNYEGPIKVQGVISVTTQGTAQGLNWNLREGDANCGYTPYPNGEVSNDCGIHIHVGTSCEEDAGGHYYTTEEDPWKAVHYTVSGCPACHSENKDTVSVDAGLTSEDILGHAMIVHDISGGRIACGIIQSPMPPPLVVTDFVKYFNYEGPLTVSGSMTVSTQSGSQFLGWDLIGQDSNCGCGFLPNGPVSNDCGIHIHVGTSCDSDAGGHYFSTSEDPWKAVHYWSTDGMTTATGVNVSTDLTQEDILGHAMIVHDQSGARIACGIIKEGTVGGCYNSDCGCPPYINGADWCKKQDDWILPGGGYCQESAANCERGCNGKWCSPR